jgi:hypothetical protein
VLNTNVQLFNDTAGTNQVANAASGALSEDGTNVAFNDVPARVIRIQFTSVNGATAGLGEIEVIARGTDNVSRTISGNAGVGGVTLNYTGGVTTADGSGSYSISVLNAWSGTVTPSSVCYTFSPVNTAYTNIVTNQTAQNYTATSIPGSRINIVGNTGIAGATLSYTDGTLNCMQPTLAPGMPGEYKRGRDLYLDNTLRWRDFPKPTIAQVQGYCIMGGLMLASACDLIIAAADAKFCDRTVRWAGAHVQYASLAWDIGFRKAKEYLFTGDWLTADYHPVSMSPHGPVLGTNETFVPGP